MPHLAFTDLTLRSLKAETRTDFWDTKTPGLGMRVGTRSKMFVAKLRNRRHTLGQFPTFSLQEARKAIYALRSADKAPPATKRFHQALTEFIDEHYQDKRPRVKNEVKRLLEKHFAQFKTRVLSDITDRDIGRELSKLDHISSERLHAFRALRTFLRWCTRPPRRYLTHSPLEGYQAPSKDRKGTRKLSDEELIQLWNSCDGAFGDMVRLLILWGTRNCEVGRLRRSWIEGDVLTIPGDVTKNHRDHSIPILPMAQAILDRHEGELIFPGRVRGEHFKDGSWGKPKRELVERSRVTKWQLRDIRRTFRSNMPALGVSRELSEILLNHVSGTRNELDEIYDRYDYLPEKRAALARWEARLKDLCVARQSG